MVAPPRRLTNAPPPTVMRGAPYKVVAGPAPRPLHFPVVDSGYPLSARCSDG